MARWRQDKETGKLIPVDEAAARRDFHSIHGDIEPFRSPVDGSVITDRKQLRDHNKRNNVVHADEFSPEFYERKAEERRKFFAAERSPEERHKIKQELYEKVLRAERGLPYE